jgi:hypothetical protein
MSKNATELFAENVISQLNKRITDLVFLEIQSDRELMQQYLGLVEAHGLAPVNRTIGKAVKAVYGLTDADRENNPQSTLIQSHQRFE